MKKSLKVLASILVLLMLAASGCGKQETAPKEQGEAGEEPVEVVIGYSGPLSGVAAEYGLDCLYGIEFAVEEINKSGGFEVNGKKYVFRLEALDDAANPTQSVSNANRLKEMGAVAISNPVMTSIAPMLEINEEAGSEFLMLAFTSVSTATEMGNKLVICYAPPFTTYVKAFSELAWERGWRKGAMVVTLGAYGDAWRHVFSQVWTAMGGEITADQPANYYGEVDFSAQLTAALATNPDFLLVGGPSHPTALVIEQAREMGFEGGFILIDQAKMDYIESLLGMEMLSNVIGVGRVSDYPVAFAKEFDRAFTSKYSVMNSWEAVLNYAMIRKLALAMQAAGTVDDVYAIRNAFPEIYPVLGDQFPVEYFGVLENGATLIPPMVQTIENGQYSDPIIYIYWTESEEEFAAIKSMAKAGDYMARMTMQ